MSFWKHFTDAAYCLTLRPYITWHQKVTGKYGEAVNEKFGNVPKREGNRKCLLVHAVSVGEALAARTVIQEFEKRFQDWDIRISVSTSTGRKVAQDKYGADKVSFFPLDVSSWVAKFYDNVRPDAIILMELEVWPNFLGEASARNIPVIVANARVTEKSAKQYRTAALLPVVKRMLNQPLKWLAQTEEYADRLREIGVNTDKIVISGSVKFDTIPTIVNTEDRNEYRQLLGAEENCPVILGGSTHPSEEDHLLNAYSALKDDFTGLKLVLVPRHPHRLEEVEKAARQHGEVIRRSKIAKGEAAQEPIILVDTMGELGKLYTAADVVFVGGTFINHGGQNMGEPCGLARPTIIGPSYHNFNETVDALKKAGGIRILPSPVELKNTIYDILKNPEKSLEMAEKGRESLIKLKGASAKTIDILEEALAISPNNNNIVV